MTVLSVAQKVAKKVGLTVPDVLVTGTSRELVELLEVIQESAEEIADGHNWELLNTEATVTGDGSAEAFALPSDYDGMVQGADVWSSSLETPLSRILDVNKWLGLDIQSFDFVINAWIIYGGQIRIKPALGNGVTAKYFYRSNLLFAPTGGGSNITQITADTDTFRLDERLLELCAIWKWKESKGQPYAEAMADYELLKSRKVARDGGAREIRMGRVRVPIDVKTAYPQSITTN